MNNKGADQPAHTRRLISAFAILILESIISNFATGEISIFQLVFVDEETGLSLAVLETPKTGFLKTRPMYDEIPHIFLIYHNNTIIFPVPNHFYFKADSKFCSEEMIWFYNHKALSFP